MNRRHFLLSGAAGSVGLHIAAAHSPGIRAAAAGTGPHTQLVGEGRRYDSPETPAGMLIVAPSTVAVGEPFWVGVKMIAAPYTAPFNCFTEHYPTVESSTNLSPRGTAYMDNVPARWSGTGEIEPIDGYDGPASVRLGGDQGPYSHDTRPIGRFGPVRFTEPGTHVLTIHEPVSGLTGRSNPIQVTASPPTERLYWGDIHGHTIFTDAIRSPEEYYFFGRDEAFLDVCAITEHAEFYVTPRQWEYLTTVTNDFNEPERFVTLVAQEWTSAKYGHRNLYYRGDSAPLVRATDPAWSEIDTIYALAREHGALVVPHHSASSLMGVNWSLGHDPEVERLVEVFSCWGSSERPAAAGNPRPIHEGLGGESDSQHVVDALRLGRQFGIIGSGDTHDGRPGDTLHHHQFEPANYRYTQRGGLVGIWCPRLTRESVFDALWNRSVFATTGVRILLKFSVAGQPMGSTVSEPLPQTAEIEVASEVPISRVDIVRAGEDLLTRETDSQTVSWSVQLPPCSGTQPHYVRVVRADGEMAWSSPIWTTG